MGVRSLLSKITLSNQRRMKDGQTNHTHSTPTHVMSSNYRHKKGATSVWRGRGWWGAILGRCKDCPATITSELPFSPQISSPFSVVILYNPSALLTQFISLAWPHSQTPPLCPPEPPPVHQLCWSRLFFPPLKWNGVWLQCCDLLICASPAWLSPLQRLLYLTTCMSFPPLRIICISKLTHKNPVLDLLHKICSISNVPFFGEW